MDARENICYAVGCVCFAAIESNGTVDNQARIALHETLYATFGDTVDTGYVQMLLYPLQRAGNSIDATLTWALDALEYGQQELTLTLRVQLLDLLNAVVPASTEAAAAINRLKTTLQTTPPTSNTSTAWNSSCKVATLLTA